MLVPPRSFSDQTLEPTTEWVEVGPGEFLFVPAEIVHVEANPYDEPCVAIVARSPDNIVVPVVAH